MAKIWNVLYSLDESKMKIKYIFEWTRPPEWTPRNSQNPYTTLWLILGGSRLMKVGNLTFRIGPQDLVIIPPYTAFTVHEAAEEPLHYVSCSFDWKVGSFDFVQLFSFPQKMHFGKSEEFVALKAIWLELQSVWVKFVNEVFFENAEPRLSSEALQKPSSFPSKVELSTPQTGSYFIVQATFHRWAASLMELTQSRLPSVPKRLDPRIEAVCQYVGIRFAGKITIKDLCQKAFVSESQLRLLFRKNLDVSPMEYVILTRLRKAKELLMETGQSVGEISLAVGFEDVSYFIRVFRKHERTTPAEYRRKMSID